MLMATANWVWVVLVLFAAVSIYDECRRRLTPSPEAALLSSCWRCAGDLVVYLRAGRSAPCPACFGAKSLSDKRKVMIMCAPKSLYFNGKKR